jgi:hypothetical protein
MHCEGLQQNCPFLFVYPLGVPLRPLHPGPPMQQPLRTLPFAAVITGNKPKPAISTTSTHSALSVPFSIARYRSSPFDHRLATVSFASLA